MSYKGVYLQIRRKIMQIVLRIKQINEFNEYILQDIDSKKEYRLILEFCGISPKVDDILSLNKNLVDPKSKLYIQSYAFERLDNDEDNLDEVDFAGLVTDDKKYRLKRIYG